MAATEFGLMFPLIMLIVLGAVDFGRFAHTYIAVTNGARAGAGYAIMNPFSPTTRTTWEANLRQVVIDEMRQTMDADSSFGDADLVVYPPYPDGTSGMTREKSGLWRVRVTVIFPFQTIVPWPGIPNRLDLTRAVEMRGIR